nr:MAG TPA: hypothetical protein [Caudoviricetes sp.]
MLAQNCIDYPVLCRCQLDIFGSLSSSCGVCSHFCKLLEMAGCSYLFIQHIRFKFTSHYIGFHPH